MCISYHFDEVHLMYCNVFAVLYSLNIFVAEVTLKLKKISDAKLNANKNWGANS